MKGIVPRLLVLGQAASVGLLPVTSWQLDALGLSAPLFVPALLLASPLLATLFLAAHAVHLSLAAGGWGETLWMLPYLGAIGIAAARGEVISGAGHWAGRMALRHGVFSRRACGGVACALLLPLAIRSMPLFPMLPLGLLYAAQWRALCRDFPPAPWRVPAPRKETWAALLLFAVVLEGGARLLFEAEVPRRLLAPHASRIFTLRPGVERETTVGRDPARKVQLRISSQGLREDREFEEKAEDELRVLLLGDSFVMGWGVENEATLSARLEERLRAMPSHLRPVVINAGMAGYGPWQSLDWMEEWGDYFSPDVVLHGIYPANDVENELLRIWKFPRAFNRAWAQQVAQLKGEHQFQFRAEQWMRDHVRAYTALARVLPEDSRPVLSLLSFLRIGPAVEIPRVRPAPDEPYTIDLNAEQWYGELEEGFALLQESVRGIRDYCAARNIAYAAFLIPSFALVDEEAYAWHAARLERPVAPFESAKEVRVVADWLREEGITTIPLVDAMRNEAPAESLYLPRDYHLSEAGTAFAAERLFAALVLEILPERGLSAELHTGVEP